MTDTVDAATTRRRGDEPRPKDDGRDTGAGFRTDIQALRAVAVLAVVLNHAWPDRLTGGYVGVDVFFVISGFLITSHLSRELAKTGRVRLGLFYARRVRRLLPAAFLVLLSTVAAAYVLLPYPRWAATAQHALASALYAENWLLAAESVDYSALNAAPSLAQHYWSLSVEEQFYLLWPLLLLVLSRIGRTRLAVVAAAVALVGAASLAYCVHLTAHAASQAYFLTPARVWEFAVGALVALAGPRLVPSGWLAGLASFTGLAMVVGAAVRYGHTTPFPGYLALVPAAGTALVIVAGNRTGWQWHTPLTAWRPVQWLGDVSYSLYLWHWPVLVLAPFAFGGVLTGGVEPVAVAVALVLAFATKRLVEDPGRTWRPLASSSGRTFAAMVAGLAAVALAAGALTWDYQRQTAQAQRAAPADGPCFGARAMTGDCADPFGPAPVVAMGPANAYFRLPRECVPLDDHRAGDVRTTNVCDFSGDDPAPEVVWLVGDSHAVQWQGPLVELARERGWVFKSATLGGCPFANVAFTGYRGRADEEWRRTCTDWTTHMTGVVAADRPSTVFMSFFSRMEPVDDGTGRSQADQYRDGVEPYWRTWTGAGAHVVVLADPPLNGAVRPPDCVVLHPGDPRACAVDRERALPPDPLAEAARSSPEPGVALVDLSDSFCDDRRCYAVIGGVAVYYDDNHLNLEFARSLGPALAEAVAGP